LHQKLDGRPLAHPAISPDGSTVAVVTRPAGDDAALTVRVFDVDARRERVLLPGGRAVAGLVFSPDGRRLTALALDGDGERAGKLVVWDVVSGERALTADMESFSRFSGEFGARLAWCPDGSRFAFTTGPWNNAAVAVHNAATGKPLVTMEQPLAGDGGSGRVPCVACSPDGSRVAAYLSPVLAGAPPVVKVWDSVSGKELLTLRPDPAGGGSGARHLTFTGDGRRLLLTELVNAPPQSLGGSTFRSFGRSLRLTTWDATPVTPREGGKP
jgi:WD40 repeat protein